LRLLFRRQQLAEKLAFATVSYQGMSLLLAEKYGEWVELAFRPAFKSFVSCHSERALQAVEKVVLRQFASRHDFSRAEKPFIIVIPRRL